MTASKKYAKVSYAETMKAGIWLMAKKSEIEEGKWTKGQMMEALGKHLGRSLSEDSFERLVKATEIKSKWKMNGDPVRGAGRFAKECKELRERCDTLDKQVDTCVRMINGHHADISLNITNLNLLKEQVEALVKELKG